MPNEVGFLMDRLIRYLGRRSPVSRTLCDLAEPMVWMFGLGFQTSVGRAV